MPPKPDGAKSSSSEKSDKAEKVVNKPSEPKAAGHDDGADDQPSEENSGDEAQYEDEEQVEFASILHPGLRETRIDDPGLVPDWHRNLFLDHDTTWDFPIVENKTGHLTNSFETVTETLRTKMANVSGELHGKYQGYIDEWKVLRQSTIYSKLVASALAQINQVITDYPREARYDSRGNLVQRLQQLESIMATLLRAQVDRATVIIAAAYHSQQGATKIAARIEAQSLGIPRHLLNHYEDLGPAPQRVQSASRTTSKRGSTWSTSAKTSDSKSDAKPAFSKKQHRSPPSPAKTSGGGESQ